MADKDRMDAVATPPRTELGEGGEPRRRSARPDPRTGEVRAGPGDAGLQDRPELNAGSPGTKQMSNRRLGIGLAIAALLAVLAVIFAALF